jgi:lysophosphatidylcholine acyltransferase/lyso-PAF acetyltransferase
MNKTMGPMAHITRTERIKRSFLFVTLFPPRLCLLIASVFIAATLANFATLGMSTKDITSKPLTGVRALLRDLIRLPMRVAFFSMGFMWYRTKGKMSTSDQARVIVANHTAFVDISLPSLCGASAVSKIENSRIPVFGALANAFSPIFVDRTDPESRKNTVEHIKQRAAEKQAGMY